MSDDRIEYQQRYYKEHKDEIAEKRQAIYRKDPERKARMLDQSAKHREKKRTRHKAKFPRHRLPKRHKAGDGGEVLLYSIGAFATFLGRSVQSLNTWEKDLGVLPPTPYRLGQKGFRFYTMPMMRVVKVLVGNKKRLFPIDPQWRSQLEDQWRRSGVPLGCDSGIDDALVQTRTKGIETFEELDEKILGDDELTSPS